ncbi:MAG: DivIVA domain-containing protein [Desulfarculus sp.]|nr:DivIVA domain-containing protein [Desulfarculus sp.]
MEAEEIRHRRFARAWRGYDPGQVQALLDHLAERMAELQAEADTARRETTQLKAELQDYRAREQSLESALNQARAASESIKQNAEREAQLLVAEAELQAEKILGQAHSRLARIHDDIAELKRQRVQFEVRLHSLVEAHLKLLDVERERDRELAELEDKIKILRTPA